MELTSNQFFIITYIQNQVSSGIEPLSQDLQSHALPLYELTSDTGFYIVTL